MGQMANLLIIDDDVMICDSMARVFADMGHDVSRALTLKEGLTQAEKTGYDVVFLDVRLPDGNGLGEIGTLQATRSAPEIIVLTGYADPDGAEKAIKANAWDYLKKPASINALSKTLKRALRYREEKIVYQPRQEPIRNNIIGESPKIKACLELLVRAADSNANILINGETGTGKELFARAIHDNSDRAGKNFVVVDCGSLPETLIESLLFGHTKGAFTGADRAEEGLIKHADGGTLFLDEVGELPMSSQKSLLRVLQERRFHPIGSTEEIESDFRLVAATNQDLEEMVRRDIFREDLLFRLRSIVIELPPLRERLDDIPLLARHYMEKLCERQGTAVKQFDPELLETLLEYPWSGNIRELFSALEWSMAQGLYEPTLYVKHLPPHIRIQVARSTFHNGDPECPGEGEAESAPTSSARESVETRTQSGHLIKWRDYRRRILEDGERRYLTDLMQQADFDIKAAADASGLSRPRLYELLRKYQMNSNGR